jgi:hypothetical protein
MVAAIAMPISLSLQAATDAPEVSAVSDAMCRYVAQQEIAGAVTLVAAFAR